MPKRLLILLVVAAVVLLLATGTAATADESHSVHPRGTLDALEARFTFDNTLSDSLDASPTRAAAVVNGAIKFTPSAALGAAAAVFDGQTALSITKRVSPNSKNVSDMSITFWLNTSMGETACPSTLFFEQGCPLIDMDLPWWHNDFGISTAGGKILLGMGYESPTFSDVTLVSRGSIADSKWHFIATTWNARTGVMSIYIDGRESSSRADGPKTPRDAANNVIVGRRRGGYGNYFVGALDDVRFYSRELSATDVSLLYKERPVKSPQLVWKPNANRNCQSTCSSYRNPQLRAINGGIEDLAACLVPKALHNVAAVSTGLIGTRMRGTKMGCAISDNGKVPRTVFTYSCACIPSVPSAIQEQFFWGNAKCSSSKGLAQPATKVNNLCRIMHPVAGHYIMGSLQNNNCHLPEYKPYAKVVGFGGKNNMEQLCVLLSPPSTPFLQLDQSPSGDELAPSLAELGSSNLSVNQRMIDRLGRRQFEWCACPECKNRPKCKKFLGFFWDTNCNKRDLWDAQRNLTTSDDMSRALMSIFGPIAARPYHNNLRAPVENAIRSPGSGKGNARYECLRNILMDFTFCQLKKWDDAFEAYKTASKIPVWKYLGISSKLVEAVAELVAYGSQKTVDGVAALYVGEAGMLKWVDEFQYC